MNFNLNFTFMKTVTMLEFRRDARKALAAVRRGERIVLTYRGRPVAQLGPVAVSERELPPHDSLRRLRDYTFDGPRSPLSNTDIDRTVYGA